MFTSKVKSGINKQLQRTQNYLLYNKSFHLSLLFNTKIATALLLFVQIKEKQKQTK